MKIRTLAMALLVAAAAAMPHDAIAASAKTSKKPAAKPKTEAKSKLLDPASLNEKAPATFQVRFDTSKGPFVVEVHRDWAPHGADRFYNLVKNGYYDDTRFFRVISGFMAQFGISGKPELNQAWREATIADDPVKQSNERGMVTFAMRGPDTRTTQLFINFANNGSLDSQGFAPFGKVVEGMDVVDKLYAGYGEGAPRGSGPRQDLLQEKGNTYLKSDFPQLDYIKTAKVVPAK